MKKTFLFFSLFLGAITVFSQETGSTKVPLNSRKHEFKVGAIKLLAGPIFEGTYERIHSRDFTYGTSLLIDFQSDNEWEENFSLTPFARFYFQESKEYGAKGFFVEGFVKVATGKRELYKNFDNIDYSKRFTAAALGLSLGKKWINHSGFVFETLIGVGRTLGNSSTAPEAFFRGDLNIGYRF